MEKADTIMQKRKNAVRFEKYIKYKDILISQEENTAKNVMIDKHIQSEYYYFGNHSVDQSKTFKHIYKQTKNIERKLKKVAASLQPN